jgi:serine/threonine-protein kinase
VVILTLLEPQRKTSLQQWCFENSSVIRIGRAGDNDVVLSDSLVSRHHLELRQVNSPHKKNVASWQVFSKGTNGTFLDGILVIQCPLPDNSLLQLAQGGPILKFKLQEMPDTLLGYPGSASVSPEGGESQANIGNNSGYTCNHEGNSPNNLFCIHCGQPLSVQQKIRQYQVLRTLGQGGMGTTYLAWDGTGLVEKKTKIIGFKANEC